MLAGHYAFIDASDPRVAGDNAFLISPIFPAALGKCLEFYYYMYGSDVGTLNVYLTTLTQNTKIWTKTGDQGKGWFHAFASIKSQDNFTVSFEGITGNGFRGDIAIDDLKIKSESCPTKGLFMSGQVTKS